MSSQNPQKPHNSEVPNTGLYLAGEFGSPAELLAAREIGLNEKREVLELWRNDLMNRGGPSEHEQLLDDIDEALQSLEALEAEGKSA